MITNYQNRYKVALKKSVDYMRLRYEKCMQHRAYKDPLQRINEKYIMIDNYVKSATNSINNKITISKKEFTNRITKLDALSPLKTLSRGYGIISKENKTVKQAKDLKTGDKINIRFIDGEKEAEVI